MDINEIFAKLGELLSYEQYSEVDAICDRLISTGHNEKELYLVKLLAEAEVKDINDLADSKTPLDKLPSYDFIIREFDKDMADYVFECNEYIYSMQKYNAKKAEASKNDAVTELVKGDSVKKSQPVEDEYEQEDDDFAVDDNFSDEENYGEDDVRQYAPKRSSYSDDEYAPRKQHSESLYNGRYEEDNYYNDQYASDDQYEDDEYEQDRRRSKKKSKFAASFDDEDEYEYEDDEYDDDYDDEEVTADIVMLIIAIILGVIDIGSFVFTLVSGAI